MPEKSTEKRFQENIDKAQDIKAFLDEIGDDPEIATMTTKPVISMLSTAAEYLAVNMSQLQRRHLHETGK